MKKKFFTVGLVLTLTSCQLITKNVETSVSELETDSVSFKKANRPYNFSVIADFPIKGNPALVRNVREWISESLGGTYEGELADTTALFTFYADKYLKTSSEGEDSDFINYLLEDSIDCEASYEFKLHWQNDSLVTYTLNCYTYGGGAHGLTTFQGATFRKSDGRHFGWDMIQNGVDLNEDLKKGLKKYFEVTTDEELMGQLMLMEDWRDASSLPKPQTEPWIDGDGLHMTYQQYEICSYAQGMPSVDISMDRTKEVVVSGMKEAL